jgi:hypothetical protein
MANKAGLYDAADYILTKLCAEERTIFEECNNNWKRLVHGWRKMASKAVHEPERYPNWIKGFVESATHVLQDGPDAA